MKILRFFGVAVVAILILTPSVRAMKIYDSNGRLECDTENPDGCDVLSGNEIHLEKKSGVYELPVTVNGAVTLNFILDTGASEVNIPADVASTLLGNGTISQDDFLPGKIYKSADGSLRLRSRVIIRKMDLGGVTVSRVPASIGPASGLLLLGQSFLKRLPSWSLDNKRDILVIGK
jgi:clan AA aspartic protease (TIGR02281 family)